MKRAIIFIGIYLIVTAILVYQVINPIQSEIIIINRDLKKQTVDSLNNVKDLTKKTELKNEIKKGNKMSGNSFINKDL